MDTTFHVSQTDVYGPDYTMKVLVALLLVLLLALQWRLWFGDGSLQELSRLKKESANSRNEVIRLTVRNQALAAEVADLKSGLDAIEERARAELGMIDEGETFYQFTGESIAEKNASRAIDKSVDNRRSSSQSIQVGTPVNVLQEGVSQ